MAANMYRVGDYVYFETSSASPYQIRRIEELCKTASGNVEAKVMCFYRRRDISSSLIVLADKHQSTLEEDSEGNGQREELSEKQRHQLRHKELFLSRQSETLPATHIRGKCSVTLLNETELLSSYLNKDDTFFYSLVYDPQQKTLLADKGEIRVGSRFQAEPQALLTEGESDGRNLEDLEELVWNPENSCGDKQIDQFLVIARSVGTFARALDCASTIRQPSLHMSAAAASRDITLYQAMNALHKHNYNMTQALESLIPVSGPVLCRDEMEEWSASEANLFEEALDKYGKDFSDIRQDFLSWKSLKSIVEYYYMWKTTDRYVQQKRIKAAEAESKLKQVYIPNYNKPNPAQIIDKMNGIDGLAGRPCESCYVTVSSQWYMWGPNHMQCRLCAGCWNYWKRYGGLKMPTRLGTQENDTVSAVDRLQQIQQSTRLHKCTIIGCGKEFKMKTQLARHLSTAHGLAIRAGSPCPVMKTRAAFCLITTPLTRISRQLCKGILDINRTARRPFIPINIALIKQECQQRLPELMKKLRLLKAKKRAPMEKISAKLGIDTRMEKPSLLHHTAENRSKYSGNLTSSVSNRSASSDHSGSITSQTTMVRKRAFDQINGMDGEPAAKYPTSGVIRQAGAVKQIEPKIRGSAVNRLNGRNGEKHVLGRNRKVIANWMDTPDDICFYASKITRRSRKQFPVSELRRAARKPCRNLPLKMPGSKDTDPVVVLD